MITSATTPVAGTSTAESEAGVGTSYTALLPAAGTAANLMGAPLPADVKAALKGNPLAKAAFGRGSTMFALGQLQGAHSSTIDEQQTETSTAISIDTADLATPGELTIAFLSPQTTSPAGIDGISLTVVVDGNAMVAQSFTSEAGAAQFFTDDVVDLGGDRRLPAQRGTRSRRVQLRARRSLRRHLPARPAAPRRRRAAQRDPTRRQRICRPGAARVLECGRLFPHRWNGLVCHRPKQGDLRDPGYPRP